MWCFHCNKMSLALTVKVDAGVKFEYFTDRCGSGWRFLENLMKFLLDG